MANKILSDEEIKDKILSLDIAKECYAYYYKILYDKYLQLLKCHQSESHYEKKSRNQTITTERVKMINHREITGVQVGIALIVILVITNTAIFLVNIH